MRPGLGVVRSDAELRALEAVRHVAGQSGFRTAELKPCVVFLLDGNIGGAQRREAAFVIAIECRRLQLSEREAEKVLARWAKKVGIRQREAFGAIPNAYAKKDGRWRYHPPGLSKKHGSIYDRVLSATCADVGCPANCAPYAHVYRGPRHEGFAAFEKLGWPDYFRKTRHVATIDWYRAVCELERERGFAAGSPLLTSYGDLARLARHSHAHTGENLRLLYTLGLLALYERGSGSGPKAADRKPTSLKRAVPIPRTPASYRAAITTGADPAPHIGAPRAPEIGDGSALDIGARDDPGGER
jgi:hypothetical protein